MSADDTSLGLRERKKRATRDALADMALRMAAARGIEHVTVEAVTDAVGVSVRTFFNYFPCLEEAITRPGHEHAERTRRAVLNAPEHLTALEALSEALAKELAQVEEDHERWELQMAVLRTSPSLLPGFLAAQGADERALVAVLAERLGQDPETDLQPRLLAHVAIAAVRATVEVWVASGRTRTFQSLYREAFASLAAGLRT
ncbi:TetR family transcriptional regulator [Streptomyces poriferorum]|uniref:TetR family transcriptional regulator n=1 Tax=Streptomyces poriferorum TaxID=2798799 RepID=A0ABY9IXQ5_9ACTN|nr:MULTISPECIES: TetR family transcriptional regulator [Streptomyces]MBW5250970.1 TetR family transcriptional regulator [Streptomyces poriferorum]MBW5259396.1 TetR family transcriptional regulator [Streptomyces poriferorum]MDP5310576.1 TetR family transcriptional regulator [Streptomyces sp. Alt4]WLQ47019.1 TetR family transcriptional regulator [Streptomyces sp. Alt1]WLQ60273.1 TetR family transcriptional regulator [Streptomyces sp. Alt2]